MDRASKAAWCRPRAAPSARSYSPGRATIASTFGRVTPSSARTLGRERLVNAEQSKEHVLVLHRPLTGVVDRVGERHLQARHDAKAARAGLLERARPERLFQPFAHAVEVDPERRKRVGVDSPRRRAGEAGRLGDVAVAHIELPKAS